MTIRAPKRVPAYLFSAGALLALLALVQPTASIFGAYYAISFWLLVVLDAIVTRMDKTSPNGYPFEDRFIGYIFVAPFIWPARVLELANLNSSR